MTNSIQLLDFYTSNCGACQMQGLVLEQLSIPEHVTLQKIDAEEQPDLAGKYQIFAVPTLILIKNGEIVRKQQGFLPKSVIESWLKEVE